MANYYTFRVWNTTFAQVLHREIDDALDVDWDGPELQHPEGEFTMTPPVDVLQSVGVSADNTQYVLELISGYVDQHSITEDSHLKIISI